MVETALPENAATHDETPLMAHLLRRAGFGATQQELEAYVAQGYEAVVHGLLHPENAPAWNDDLVRRYHVDQNSLMLIESSQSYWMYRMINTRRPLEEKIALFWHGLFATAYGKLNHAKAVSNQVNTFRRHGLGTFRNLLSELSRDPAMIFWLDNKDNHKDAPNENYGRELLELFSMGIGAYNEDDVKACARAFTGWTIANQDYMSVRASRDSIWPHGRLDWQFQYRPEDHDDGPKTFLGQTGRFNGEDILDIICQHPASSWFVAGKLYAFFVSDVPDEGAIQLIAEDLRERRRRHSVGPADPVPLGGLPFRRGPVRQGEEPRRTGGGHGPAGRQLHLPGLEHRQPGLGRWFHGPGDTQPSDGGGLAHRNGMGRHRDLGGTGELQCADGGRRPPTRCGNGCAQAARPTERVLPRRTGGSLPAMGRCAGNLGGHPPRVDHIRRLPGRPPLRTRFRSGVRQGTGGGVASTDAIHPRIPDGLGCDLLPLERR